MVSNALQRKVIALLNEIYRNSEKASPFLPNTFEELIEFSKKHNDIGRLLDDDTKAGVLLYVYYIPDDKLEKVIEKTCKKLGLNRRLVSWDILNYAPTSNRKLFEKWKKRLEGCKSEECVAEKIREYAVSD